MSKRVKKVDPLPAVKWFNGNAVRFIGDRKSFVTERIPVLTPDGNVSHFSKVEITKHIPSYMMLVKHKWKVLNNYHNSIVHNALNK